MRIAIVGGGVSGLIAARQLVRHHQVTIYEAGDRAGGHCHAHRFSQDGHEHAVELGFFSFYEPAYPHLTRLLKQLRIPTQRVDMSFHHQDAIHNVSCVASMAQPLMISPASLARREWRHWMITLPRLWRCLKRYGDRSRYMTYCLGDMLDEHRIPERFANLFVFQAIRFAYGLSRKQSMQMPVWFVFDLLERCDMLRLSRRRHWRRLTVGSDQYVERLVSPIQENLSLRTPVKEIRRSATGITIVCEDGTVSKFDHAVIATSAEQALRMLVAPSTAEQQVLGNIRYQTMNVWLHNDARIVQPVPARNISYYLRMQQSRMFGSADDDPFHMEIHFDVGHIMNTRQLDNTFVSCDPVSPPDEDEVIGRSSFRHAIIDVPAVKSQSRHSEISGADRIHYCGAYWGNGLHDSAISSGLAVARELDVLSLVPRLSRMC